MVEDPVVVVEVQQLPYSAAAVVCIGKARERPGR
jgi:hypothetical protein